MTSVHESQSVLTIDLGRIVANYQNLRARLAGAQCAAVVKADAYGLGAVHVAPALASAGCREFFVATIAEGVEVRPRLPATACVYVLSGVLASEASDLIAYDLVPVLNDISQIEIWASAARATGRRLPAIVQFDTGMSRLGLTPAEASRIAAEPTLLDGIDLRYVMSHLARAEERDQPMNARQLAEFGSIRARWPKIEASLANSSGIFLGPAYHFDLVRPGCALYGINPTPGLPNPLAQVAVLSGKILQIRDVDPPRTVGYGATHRVERKTRVATVAVGYADGWLRTLSNRGWAYYGDVRVPFIGRVSMDLITLDVTAAPLARPGDAVELMGDRLPVDTIAELAGTIGYEVMTRLGRRFARVYLNDPARR
jgi:alanine racemase